MKELYEFLVNSKISKDDKLDLYRTLEEPDDIYIGTDNIHDFEYVSDNAPVHISSFWNSRIHKLFKETDLMNKVSGKVSKCIIMMRPDIRLMTNGNEEQRIAIYSAEKEYTSEKYVKDNFEKTGERIGIEDFTVKYWKKHKWRIH